MVRKAVVTLALLALPEGCSRADAPATNETVRSPAAIGSPGAARPAAPSETLGSSRTNVSDMDLATAEKEIARAQKELGDALSLAAPDCAVLGPLRDRICELAERICRLSASDPDIKARCDDGRNRCSDAKARVGSQCP